MAGFFLCANFQLNAAAVVFLVVVSILQSAAVSGAGCNETDTFVKISGFVPPSNSLILLYNRPNSSVTEECHDRCKSSTDCPGFVIDYEQSACFRVNASALPLTYTSPRIITGRRITYFERACMKVPGNCTDKWWTLERVMGYVLVDLGVVLPYATNSSQDCAERCFQEDRFQCRSAVFSNRGCVLSAEDRRTRPDAYRASPNEVEYLENQCIETSPEGQTCSFEEFPENELKYPDVEAVGTTQVECRSLCEEEKHFTCRSLTYISSPDNRTAMCKLHGEDTTSLGPSSLTRRAGAVYMERVPCLDLMVMCTNSSMTVSLHTREPFNGRMYVQGRSEKCNSEGRGSSSTILTIPLETAPETGRMVNKCGVMMARSIGDFNRTLLSAVVIVQHNPIIQKRGDRAVKIGCVLDGSFKRNVTLGYTLTFSSTDYLPGVGTIIVNSTTSVIPTVSLHIYDLSKPGHQEAKETQLGQNLEFRIDLDPPDGPYDIKAGHLVATSDDGTESYLLLDENGCPPDPQTFPAFREAGPNSKSLVANFRAFKFPRSPIVRFNVMVQFCPGQCEPSHCENNIRSSQRRRKRDSNSVIETEASLYQELPMQLTLMVHNSQVSADSIVRPLGNNSNILLLTPEEPGAICLYYGAIIGLVMSWMLLQFLLLVACYFTMRYRAKTRCKDQTRLQDDMVSNFSASYDNHRHVHWADQGSI